MRIFQKGFNFAQDGPGNRLVYHLQGRAKPIRSNSALYPAMDSNVS